MQLVSAALADPTRYRVLELICGRDVVTCQGLSETLRLAPATISHHLRELRLAGLIESTRDGRWRMHTMRRETLAKYIEVLSGLVEVSNH